jgi:hypothetical protein
MSCSQMNFQLLLLKTTSPSTQIVIREVQLELWATKLCPLYSTGKNMPDQYENVGSLGKLSCATYTPYLSIHRCIDPLIYRFTSLIAVYLFICCARNEARITGSSNASSNNEKFVAETAMTCNDIHPTLHGYK